MKIVQKESPLALYKGLGAVTAGIVPKMAIRFTTFQFYKDLMIDKNGTPWKLNNLWGRSFTLSLFRCCFTVLVNYRKLQREEEYELINQFIGRGN